MASADDLILPVTLPGVSAPCGTVDPAKSLPTIFLMTSVLHRLLGVGCLALLLTACAASDGAGFSSTALEPENVLTIGAGAPEPVAYASPAAAPAAASPVAKAFSQQELDEMREEMRSIRSLRRR